MPVHKNQLRRLSHIVSQLKENRYPNSETLIRDFKRMALEEEIDISCVKKTILRDINTLKNEYAAPIDFDRAQNGYFLKHHGWHFNMPVILDDNDMLAAVIGARVAENIFPSPLKNTIRKSVDTLLQENNPDFLDHTNMKSLTILTGTFINLDHRVFMSLFNGWQTRCCVRITYMDYQKNISERIFEPHTLVYYDNAWYSKGFCHLKKAVRTLQLQRIQGAELLNRHFDPDHNIIDSITLDDFLGFEKVNGVKIKVNDYVRERLETLPMHSHQEISADNIVSIPAICREILFPFLLSQGSNAILLEPPFLCDEFQQELKNILEAYQQ